MQALQNIAVIQGRPVLWGDGALAVVRAHPLCESVVERGPVESLAANAGQCTIKRKDQAQPITRDFTLEMAETAGLVKRSGPEGPWTKYRGRMLMHRARAWAMRDALPEALKGLSIREEIQDIEPIPAPVMMPKRLLESKESSDKTSEPLKEETNK